MREKYLSRTQWEGKVKGFRDKEGVCNNTFASSKEISTSWKFKQEVILSFVSIQRTLARSIEKHTKKKKVGQKTELSLCYR